MNKISFFIIFISIGLLSCCSQKENSADSPIIDFGETTNSIKASQLIQIENSVKLETKDECLIGYIDHACIYNDHIYILDSWISKSLFVFNNEGKYITKISAVSGGEGEFLIPYNFEIDKENNILLLNDIAQNKLLFYDIRDLKYIKSITYKEKYNAICKLTNKDLYIGYKPMHNIHENNSTQIDILDSNLNKQKGLIKADPRTSILSGKVFNFYNTKQSVVVFPFFSNKLYNITADTATVRYELRFGEYDFPTNDFFNSKQYEPIPIFQQLEKEELIQNIYPYETTDHLLIKYDVKKNNFLAIHNKHTKKSINIAYDNIINDLGISYFPIPIFNEGENITGYIDASDMNSAIKKGDNPILITFKTII